MKKINFYLFILTNKYLFVNLILISFFIFFINIIELSRVIDDQNKNIINFVYLSFLKYPSILNEIFPFVIIIAISFLIRNLISNNEFISMRNLGYSIFDIFIPISIAVFMLGLFFLFFLNPLSVFMKGKYNNKLNKNETGLYSIKINENEMWIKNEVDLNETIFINIKNIDLQDMNASNIKILLTNENSNKFILAESGEFKKNVFSLYDAKFYDFKKEELEIYAKYDLNINFNKDNIINSISEYKLLPFYKYIEHSKTLIKFNLYSSEIGLYYLFEILKPFFIVVLSFVILGFTSSFKRNENFFKVLLISISIGFSFFLMKEIISKLTINLSINFYISYMIIFFIPLFIGLYQIIKVENE